MEIKVEITADGRAKELNNYQSPEPPYVPFYKPYGMSDEEYEYEVRIAENRLEEWQMEETEKWQAAEQARKTYNIEPRMIVIGHTGTHNEFGTVIFEPGSVHNAIIINETTVRIA